MADQNILYEKKDKTAVVTIHRPPANSWNMAAMTEFEKNLDDSENDPDIRVLIITGAGEKCFSAGMDVADAIEHPELGEKGRALWRRVDRLKNPPSPLSTVTPWAAGWNWLCAATSGSWPIPQSKNRLTELNLGIIPGWGGTQRLYRVVGKSRALDMILFSRVWMPGRP